MNNAIYWGHQCQAKPYGSSFTLWGFGFGSVGKGILAWWFWNTRLVIWCIYRYICSICMCFMMIWWLFIWHGNTVIHSLSASGSYIYIYISIFSELNMPRICPFLSPTHGGFWFGFDAVWTGSFVGKERETSNLHWKQNLVLQRWLMTFHIV